MRKRLSLVLGIGIYFFTFWDNMFDNINNNFNCKDLLMDNVRKIPIGFRFPTKNNKNRSRFDFSNTNQYSIRAEKRKKNIDRNINKEVEQD